MRFTLEHDWAAILGMVIIIAVTLAARWWRP